MTKILFADVEGDNFLEDLTTMWTIQIADSVDGPVDVYADQPGYEPIAKGLKRLKAADKIVMHYGLGFDLWAINKLYPGTLRWQQIIDSVIVSRLINSKASRHSLKDLGESLGFPKGDFKDFAKFSEEMVTYGIQDVRILQKAWTGVPGKKVIPFGTFYEKFRRACDIEFQTAYIIAKQEMYGVQYDNERAQLLETDLRQEYLGASRQLQEIFPPITHERISEKTGKKLKDFVEVFNPASGPQIESRLVTKYNWKPKKRTPSGQAKTDEEILNELPYPEAKAILEYKKAEKKLGQLADGDAAWAKVIKEQPDGTYRIHGKVNTLGARTHRMSHFAPNLGNVNKDPRMRECFVADEGWLMVGTDAEGLELRMLAHFLHPYDEGKYVTFVHSGDKALGTDVHTMNQKSVGYFNRESAKTAIYAHNYGCFDNKLGQITIDDAREAGMPRPEGATGAIGAAIRRRFETGIVGLGQLIEKCKRSHRNRDALPGVDGRWIPSGSDHSALNTLLQGNGSVVMKVALNHFDDEMKRLQILDQYMHAELAMALMAREIKTNPMFGYLLNVHDEFQVTCHPDVAEKVAEVGKWAIAQAGETLELRCPLVGEAKIGKNWRETH